jgi:predicted transcriptional regulator
MATASKSLMALCAADIMSRNIVMVPREMSLQGAARMLTRANVTGAPVVDDQGRCIGVLSATDFMHSVEEDRQPKVKANGIQQSWQIPECEQQPSYRVEEFMTKDPVLVPSETLIGELARLMMDAHIHRIIVVDMATHRPLGIVSSMDILAAIARVEQLPREPGRRPHFHAAGSLP